MALPLLPSTVQAGAASARTVLNGPNPTLNLGLTPPLNALKAAQIAGYISYSDGANFLLNVTAAATLAGDTLDVYIQHSVDDGVTWDDFVHFTQVLGNGGAKKFIATWVKNYTPTTAMKPPADGTLAAGVQIGPVGAVWAIKAVTVGTGSFTFSVGSEFSRMGR